MRLLLHIILNPVQRWHANFYWKRASFFLLCSEQFLLITAQGTLNKWKNALWTCPYWKIYQLIPHLAPITSREILSSRLRVLYMCEQTNSTMLFYIRITIFTRELAGRRKNYVKIIVSKTHKSLKVGVPAISSANCNPEISWLTKNYEIGGLTWSRISISGNPGSHFR